MSLFTFTREMVKIIPNVSLSYQNCQRLCDIKKMQKVAFEFNKSIFVRFWQPLTLLILVLAGGGLYYLNVFEWNQVTEIAQTVRQYWWTAPILIIVQTLLYSFALPGSLIFWIVALIYTPLFATLTLITGGMLGAMGAYWFARRLSTTWVEYVQRTHLFAVLTRRSDFLILSALRILPSFPHSLINYGSGILHIPLGRFLGSSAIGFTLKSYLYSSVVHSALNATKPGDFIRVETIGPLLIVAFLFALAAIMRNYWLRIHNRN